MLQVKVVSRHDAAEGVVALTLAAADGSPLPAWTPGAHLDLHLPGGLMRQYSLCTPAGDDRHYLIGVLREAAGRGGSQAVHDGVRVGDVLGVDGPRNHFPLEAAADESLLFAGGIGVTPILAMAESLAAVGANFQLHYCGRSRVRMAFVDRVLSPAMAGRAHVHLDDGPPAQRLEAAAAIGAPAPGRHLYVCGPGGFMDHVLGAARALGWPESHLHREYFAGAVIDHSADGPFELELRRSGRVIRVGAECSAAQALLDAGVPLSVSCEQGVCGTCITKVLDGRPDHRDLYFTDEEHRRNDSFTPCCSRSLTPRLVVDL